MNKLTKQSLKILLPLIVLIISASFAWQISQSQSKAHRTTQPKQVLLNVEAVQLKRTEYTVKLKTYGEVRPRTEGSLISQVSGTLVKVSPQFQNGGFFEAGDVLARIDDRDYVAAVTIAESDLIQAQLGLEEETARGKQAEVSWRRIGKGESASALVLRKPQLSAAKAKVASARATLSKVKLALQRTRITAPYAGRILKKRVDVGQYVTSNTQLASIYAVDYVEIRLPLSPRQIDYLTIPEQYRGEDKARNQASNETTNPPVSMLVRQGHNTFHWQGFISRAESALDSNNRQLYVVAQIDDPYRQREDGTPPLKIGQFVEASIKANTLKGIFVIPRGALYQGNTVILVENDQLVRREVQVIWTDEQNAVINHSLKAGEWLVTTPLGNPVSGTRVAIQTSKATEGRE